MPEQKKKSGSVEKTARSVTPSEKKTTKAGTPGKKRTAKASSQSGQPTTRTRTRIRQKHSHLSRKQEVRRLKILIVVISAVVLIGGILLIHHLLTPVKKGSLSGVSSEVMQYESAVESACKDAGISQFSTLMLAMMQQESSGLGTDVMQCSECPFNTEYDNTPNAIADPYYSIQVGAEYFAYCLKEAGCKSIKNTERLKIALQDYNFGNSYATWVLENYGTYSVENATEFSLMMQETLGWSSYGDPEYVEHVLRYYIAP